MKITFAWWNTSLAPPAPRPRVLTQGDKDFALDVVRRMIVDFEVDFLALGEVSATTLHELYTGLNLPGYRLFDGIERIGRLDFDIAAIYNEAKLSFRQCQYLTVGRSTRNYKLAARLDMEIISTDDPLHIFVSHWPSRLSLDADSSERHLLGVNLNTHVKQIEDVYTEPPYIVLLGDYNDEPFDRSLSENLLAVRDRKLVRTRPGLLYNPFWKLIGAATLYNYRDISDTHCGSCFHSGGVETQWKTFDQIIFSSAFVGRGRWHLDEHRTSILDFNAIGVQNSPQIFDHFPVISVIELEVQQ